METNLQIQNQNQGLELSEKTESLSKAVFHVNQLTPYPYTDNQIIDWAKSIEELMPELSPKIIKIIVDKMKIGVIAYNYKLGIQNIFEGYKIILKDRQIYLHSKKYKLYNSQDKEFETEEIKINEELERIRILLNKMSIRNKMAY